MVTVTATEIDGFSQWLENFDAYFTDAIFHQKIVARAIDCGYVITKATTGKVIKGKASRKPWGESPMQATQPPQGGFFAPELSLLSCPPCWPYYHAPVCDELRVIPWDQRRTTDGPRRMGLAYTKLTGLLEPA